MLNCCHFDRSIAPPKHHLWWAQTVFWFVKFQAIAQLVSFDCNWFDCSREIVATMQTCDVFLLQCEVVEPFCLHCKMPGNVVAQNFQLLVWATVLCHWVNSSWTEMNTVKWWNSKFEMWHKLASKIFLENSHVLCCKLCFILTMLQCFIFLVKESVWHNKDCESVAKMGGQLWQKLTQSWKCLENISCVSTQQKKGKHLRKCQWSYGSIAHWFVAMIIQFNWQMHKMLGDLVPWQKNQSLLEMSPGNSSVLNRDSSALCLADIITPNQSHRNLIPKPLGRPFTLLWSIYSVHLQAPFVQK